MKRLLCISIVLLILILIIMFMASHLTYYKYNDWWIIGKSKKEIIDKYGNFDKEYESICGYYVYDNEDEPIPSKHPVYYWIEFDKNNKAKEMKLSESK